MSKYDMEEYKMNMNLFAPTLGANINVEINDVSGPKHSSLEQLFYDVIQPTGARLSSRWIESSASHVVVEITIENQKTGRCVTAAGESVPDSLNTEIGRKYPATMAYNRAFDRAILRYLGLYNLYAETEGVAQDLNAYNTAPVQQNTAPAPQETATVQIQDPAAELQTLLRKRCTLKTYTNPNTGATGFATLGWIYKKHPGDLSVIYKKYSETGLARMKEVMPDKVTSFLDLQRFLELTNPN